MLKKGYLFLIMIIFLISISAVSAEEIVNETSDSLAIDDNINGDISTYLSNSEDINLSAPEVVKYYGGPESFVATLTDGDASPMVNRTVHITINDTAHDINTDSKGIASIALTLPSGVYDVNVAYEDINVKSKATILPSVIACDVTKIYKNDTQFYATFLDSEGNYLPSNNFLASFYLDDELYIVPIGDNGTAKLDINNKPGEYVINVSNPVTSETISRRITVLANIVENYDLMKYYNENKRFSVRIISLTSEYASGEKVVFKIEDKIIESISDSKGYAYMDTNFQAGQYVVTTSYNGFEVNNSISIFPTLYDKDMDVAVSNIIVGEDEVIEVTFNKGVTGNVTTLINGKLYSADIDNRAANITVSGLDAGTYKIEVVYSGDLQYNSVKKYASFVVEKPSKVIAPDLIKYYKGPERFVVTVKDKDDRPVVNGKVSIYLNGQTYNRTTDFYGQASMAINLNSGVYNVTSQYENVNVCSTITVKPTISGENITKIFRNATQYYATFVDTKGNPMKNAEIGFNIYGVFYVRKTNESGVARLNINLNPGEYIVTSQNPNSTEQYTNLITVLPSIVEVHNLTKYYKNASQLTFKLLDNQGRPVGAGISAKININGVFYERATNASGYVNMNINLNPGTYIATLEYNGLMASSTVDVLPILEGKDINMKYKDGTKFEVKLLDGQGRPFAGQTITFNIHGVFYNRITDENGIARLNINLMAGEYIITSMYENGAALSNKITIMG